MSPMLSLALSEEQKTSVLRTKIALTWLILLVPFVTATLRAKDGDATSWWKLLAFSESAGAELMRLGDGETRVNLTCIVDNVLALRQPPRERKAKAAPPPKSTPDRSRLDRHAGDGADYFGDEIPF